MYIYRLYIQVRYFKCMVCVSPLLPSYDISILISFCFAPNVASNRFWHLLASTQVAGEIAAKCCYSYIISFRWQLLQLLLLLLLYCLYSKCKAKKRSNQHIETFCPFTKIVLINDANASHCILGLCGFQFLYFPPRIHIHKCLIVKLIPYEGIRQKTDREAF